MTNGFPTALELARTPFRVEFVRRVALVQNAAVQSLQGTIFEGAVVVGDIDVTLVDAPKLRRLEGPLEAYLLESKLFAYAPLANQKHCPTWQGESPMLLVDAVRLFKDAPRGYGVNTVNAVAQEFKRRGSGIAGLYAEPLQYAGLGDANNWNEVMGQTNKGEPWSVNAMQEPALFRRQKEKVIKVWSGLGWRRLSGDCHRLFVTEWRK